MCEAFGVLVGLGVVRDGEGARRGVACDGRGVGRAEAVSGAAGVVLVGRGDGDAAARTREARAASRRCSAASRRSAAARTRSPSRADARALSTNRGTVTGAGAALPPIGTRLKPRCTPFVEPLAWLTGADEASRPQERTAAPSAGTTRRRSGRRAREGQGGVGDTRLLPGDEPARRPRVHLTTGRGEPVAGNGCVRGRAVRQRGDDDQRWGIWGVSAGVALRGAIDPSINRRHMLSWALAPAQRGQAQVLLNVKPFFGQDPVKPFRCPGSLWWWPLERDPGRGEGRRARACTTTGARRRPAVAPPRTWCVSCSGVRPGRNRRLP